MNEKELLSLIDKYFQGETSLEEERMLRRELRQTNSDNPVVAEAQAVFAYVAMEAYHAMPSFESINSASDVIDTASEGANTASILHSESAPQKEVNIRKRKLVWRRWSVAAAVALLVGGVGIPLWLSQDKSVCSTMIACRMDNSQETAFSLISSQLEAVSDASDEVAEEVFDGLMLMTEY